MTTHKHLKQRIRSRMGKTGERYAAARAHVLSERSPGGTAPPTAAGWEYCGGTHPDTAALANVLRNLGVAAPHTGRPLSEALVLGVGGGLGAGYILWEFAQHDARILVLGFRHSWQYPARWAATTAERLGLHADLHETGGARSAAARLDDVLGRGLPAVLWADQQRLGYRHLPAWLDCYGRNPVVAVGGDAEHVLLDDLGVAPLTVERARLADARARVGSYKHRLIATDPALVQVDAERLRAAVEEGIAAQVAHLQGRSDSFSLPAWRKWARLSTDGRNRKSWPNVFADRRGLASALVSIYEGAGPRPGSTVASGAGNLRALYADFLEEAAPLLDAPGVVGAAPAFREAAAAWATLVDAALPPGHPRLGRLRELVDGTERAVAAGDAGAAEAKTLAAEHWALQEGLDRDPWLNESDQTDLLSDLGARVERIFAVESEAVAVLAAARPSR